MSLFWVIEDIMLNYYLGKGESHPHKQYLSKSTNNTLLQFKILNL